MGKPAPGATFSAPMARPNVFQVVVLTLAAAVLMVLGVGQLLADEWRVETTRTLPASTERVGALLRDLGTWEGWSELKVNLGPQTSREVRGTAGTAGQQVVWTGAKGRATLTLRTVADDVVEYEYGYQYDGETSASPSPARGTGRIVWVAAGDGCRVTWSDGGRWGSWALRWVGWFGALQERARQTQAASLTGLELALRGGPPAAK